MKERTETIGVKDTARRLKYSLKYVYDLVYLGKLPAEKVDGKWRIPSDVVDEWLRNRG